MFAINSTVWTWIHSERGRYIHIWITLAGFFCFRFVLCIYIAISSVVLILTHYQLHILWLLSFPPSTISFHVPLILCYLCIIFFHLHSGYLDIPIILICLFLCSGFAYDSLWPYTTETFSKYTFLLVGFYSLWLILQRIYLMIVVLPCCCCCFSFTFVFFCLIWYFTKKMFGWISYSTQQMTFKQLTISWTL